MMACRNVPMEVMSSVPYKTALDGPTVMRANPTNAQVSHVQSEENWYAMAGDQDTMLCTCAMDPVWTRPSRAMVNACQASASV